MNSYIRERIDMEKNGFIGGEVDETGQGALWDWAGHIAHANVKNEIQAEKTHCEIYYALQEIFETIYKRGF